MIGNRCQPTPTPSSDEANPDKNDGERAKFSSAAAELGRLGGKKRAENMSPERRTEIAKKAAQSRWRKS